MSRGALKTMLRVLVSGLLIALIVYFIDFGKTLAILRNVRPEVLILPILLLFFQTGISTYKWKMILAIEGAHIGFLFLFKTYLIGQFISLFLPSSIGGDVYRMASIRSRVPGFSLHFSSVIFDRVSGLYGLLLVAAIGSAILLHHEFTYLLLGCVLVGPLLFALFTHPAISGRLRNNRLRLVQIAGDILASHRKFVTSGWIFPIMGISLLFHGLVVVINFLYAQALGLEIRFVELATIVPLVYITDMIPLSINGIGVRDSAFVFFFNLLGYPAEQAFALALLLIAIRYVFGSVGGLLLLGDILMKGRTDVPVTRQSS